MGNEEAKEDDEAGERATGREGWKGWWLRKGGWGEWGTGKRAEGERTQNIEMGVQGVREGCCVCLGVREEEFAEKPFPF